MALDVVATAALKVLLRILRQMQIGGQARLNAGGQLLRHLNINPHLVNVGDAEQLRPAAAAGTAAGIDQGADIGFARGHDAVERRDDPFEAFQRLQTIDLALIGGDFGYGRVEARGGAVVIGLFALLLLLGDDALGRVAPALEGRLGELSLGLSDFDRRFRRIQLGFRRGQLGIEIRSVDLGQKVALLHVGAVIEVPVLQIAADARINRRLVPGLDGAGQREALNRRALSRRNDGDGRNGLLLRPLS